MPSQDIDWSKSDMWALGCILGELLDRQLLFPSDGTPQDQLRSIAYTLKAVSRADQGAATGHTEVRIQ